VRPTPVNPPTLASPRGYSNGLLMPPGRILFVAGQIGWDDKGNVPSDDLVAQFDLALANMLEVVRAAGGTPEHVGRITIYVLDRDEYGRRAEEIGKAYRARMGKHYPAMALLQVGALYDPRAKVELEATAVIPV
jgi:enamine deaminase RidA (YjgF/YER057c/UK114 family)